MFGWCIHRHGLTQINPLGEKFNPNEHEAVFVTEDKTKQVDSVAVVSKLGYRLKDRVIRPALVGVVKHWSSSLPSVCLTVWWVSTLKHLWQTRARQLSLSHKFKVGRRRAALALVNRFPWRNALGFYHTIYIVAEIVIISKTYEVKQEKSGTKREKSSTVIKPAMKCYWMVHASPSRFFCAWCSVFDDADVKCLYSTIYCCWYKEKHKKQQQCADTQIKKNMPNQLTNRKNKICLCVITVITEKIQNWKMKVKKPLYIYTKEL